MTPSYEEMRAKGFAMCNLCSEYYDEAEHLPVTRSYNQLCPKCEAKGALVKVYCEPQDKEDSEQFSIYPLVDALEEITQAYFVPYNEFNDQEYQPLAEEIQRTVYGYPHDEPGTFEGLEAAINAWMAGMQAFYTAHPEFATEWRVLPTEFKLYLELIP